MHTSISICVVQREKDREKDRPQKHAASAAACEAEISSQVALCGGENMRSCGQSQASGFFLRRSEVRVREGVDPR